MKELEIKKREVKFYNLNVPLVVGKTQYLLGVRKNLNEISLKPSKKKMIMGLTRYEEAVILLDSSLPLEKQDQILYHEIAHAMIRELEQVYGTKKSNEIIRDNLHTNEEFIEDLGRILRTVVQSTTKKLVKDETKKLRRIIKKLKKEVNKHGLSNNNSS